ncbi:RsmE family RNA methyltransferase [Acetomicrobium sp.]|uniref:RsmE family RNA methyltransferase n=1 Tax=Acetomicrobium sp. TaxID=1872099 RepID=UPI0031595328
MSLPRARLDRAEKISDNMWSLDLKESHHLLRVRRCRIGEEFEGLLEGRKLLLKIEGYEQGRVIAKATGKLPIYDRSRQISLLIALVKNNAFEDILNHATELGVAEIIPILAERSVVQLKGQLTKKMERWRRIIAEATKISGIGNPPLLHTPLKVLDLRDESLPSLRLLGALTDDAKPLGSVNIKEQEDIVFAVGPEGDWTEGEMAYFARLKFLPVSLGPNILRANTAAIAGLSYIILCTEGV